MLKTENRLLTSEGASEIKRTGGIVGVANSLHHVDMNVNRKTIVKYNRIPGSNTSTTNITYRRDYG